MQHLGAVLKYSVLDFLWVFDLLAARLVCETLRRAIADTGALSKSAKRSGSYSDLLLKYCSSPCRCGPACAEQREEHKLDLCAEVPPRELFALIEASDVTRPAARAALALSRLGVLGWLRSLGLAVK